MLLLLRNRAFIPTRSEVLPENTIIKSEHAPCSWENLRWQKVGIVVERIKGFRHTSIHYEYLWPLLADYYYLLIRKSFVINFSFAAARCSHLLLCLPSPSGFSWKFPADFLEKRFLPRNLASACACHSLMLGHVVWTLRNLDSYLAYR